MNVIQATLGQVLLLLIGLALVLLVIILLLMEAHYIVRLSGTLARRLRQGGPDPIDHDHAERRHEDQGVR